MPHSYINYLIFTLIMFSYVESRLISVPTKKNPSQVRIKLQSPMVVRKPDFDFSKVYRRTVQEINPDKSATNKRFGPCHQKRPQIQFTSVSEVQFQGIPARPIVIYNFDDIRYSQFLLDSFYQNLSIFLIFKNGKAAHLQINKQYTILSHQIFDISGISLKNTFLQLGYFIKVNSNLLFVNDKVCVKVEQKRAYILKGYTQNSNFESVVEMENGYFAVADSDNGVAIYRFDQGKGEIVYVRNLDISKDANEVKDNDDNDNDNNTNTTTNSTQQNQQQQQQQQEKIVDLVYSKQLGCLIVLDQISGISSYKITYSTPNPQKQSPSFLISISPPSILSTTPSCQILSLSYPTLYCSCSNQITSLSLSTYPIVTPRKLPIPLPNIQIKQIYPIDNMIAFVGKNIFGLLYLQRVVDYYQDGNLDRLIFVQDMYISANQQGVTIGNINLIQPYIQCYTQQKQYLGVNQVVFTVVAECNTTYLKQNNIQQQEIGTFTQEDTCIYSQYVTIQYWEVGHIYTYPYIGVGVGLLVVLLVILGYCCVRRVKIGQIQKMLAEHIRGNNNSESAKHHQLQQEMEDYVDKNIQDRNNKDRDEENKGTESELKRQGKEGVDGVDGDQSKQKSNKQYSIGRQNINDGGRQQNKQQQLQNRQQQLQNRQDNFSIN